MGELVSLFDYRETKRKEAADRESAQLDALREIVDAWIEVMGEPESEPIVVLSGDTLEPVTLGGLTGWI